MGSPIRWIILLSLVAAVIGSPFLSGCGAGGDDRPLSIWLLMEGDGKEVLQIEIERFLRLHPGL